ncbi:type IV toxin-antitoxin system AbiEi family antitoxin domain-containing protein [Sinomonas albida]|uniref:type IV toxin-antitoxin system AbiEi family antitoxin domain-containing protein n=1 Tax=Sinomonas albida TaxID=369942 RepID=UPI0010A83176|nr:type IV toxin-antitoxin system AbiEi family antitoxin domain-containing protein [Sinomonas albida]
MEARTAKALLAAKWPQTDVVSTGGLRAAGIDDRLLTQGVRTGAIMRLRRGAYIPAHRWHELAPWCKDEARLDAHIEGTDGSAIYCFNSAATLHGCSVWNTGPAIHVATGYSGANASRASDTASHQLGLVDAEIVVVVRRGRKLKVTSLSRTVADCARFLSLEQAAVIGDSALQRGLDLQSVRHEVEAGSMRGRRRALSVLDALEPLTESVGETRTRLLLQRLGFERPVAQLEIPTPAGLYRADLAWPTIMVIIEFDGEGKYTDYGPTPEALIAERRRETLLMEQGWVFVRLRWSDLDRPLEVQRRIEAAIARATKRSA